MIKITLTSILLLLFGLAPHVFAQGFVPLAPIPGLTQGVVADSAGLANFFNNLYKYIIGLAAVIAVVQIIWAGLEIAVFQKDSVSAISINKGRIYNAIFGLVLVLSPVLVFSIINPSILNLSLNIPPLNTTSGTSVATGGGTGGTAGQNTGQQWCYLNIDSATHQCSDSQQACDTARQKDIDARVNVSACGASSAPTSDAASLCTTQGVPSILQFATCPSGVAAQAWGQENCSGGGILSEITAITNNPDGTAATSRVSCTQSNTFEFIDVHTSASLIPNLLQPLAVASNSRINGSDTLYQTNGSDAVQYANICRSIGWQTCVSDAPSLTISHTCSPLPRTTLPAGAPSPAKCYTEKLSCKDASVANLYCTGSPSWSPFQ